MRLVQWLVQASWWRRLVPVFWWIRLGVVFLVVGPLLVVCFGVSVNLV